MCDIQVNRLTGASEESSCEVGQFEQVCKSKVETPDTTDLEEVRDVQVNRLTEASEYGRVLRWDILHEEYI